jgi:glycosyltransferase involved in cell wall biosynthesis
METSWTAAALPALVRAPRPDVALGVVPSLSGGLLAALTGKLRGIPYVIHVQDLVGRGIAQAWSSRTNALAGAVESMEMRLARGAAAVSVVSSGMGDHLERQGVEAGRIRCIRNWTRARGTITGRADARAALGWPADRFIVLHSGNIGAKHGLTVLVQVAAAAAASGRDDVLFVVRGNGGGLEALRAEVAAAGLSNIRFEPLASDDDFELSLAAADVLLACQRPEVTNMALPSKLTSYFAAGRPVLAAVAEESEAAREVTRAGAGIVADPRRPQQVLSALARLQADASLAARLGAAGQVYARDHLGGEAAITAFDGLLAGVARPAAPQGRTPARNVLKFRPRREPREGRPEKAV